MWPYFCLQILLFYENKHSTVRYSLHGPSKLCNNLPFDCCHCNIYFLDYFFLSFLGFFSAYIILITSLSCSFSNSMPDSLCSSLWWSYYSFWFPRYFSHSSHKGRFFMLCTHVPHQKLIVAHIKEKVSHFSWIILNFFFPVIWVIELFFPWPSSTVVFQRAKSVKSFTLE